MDHSRNPHSDEHGLHRDSHEPPFADPHLHDGGHHDGGHPGGHGSIGKYLAVFVALVVLTIISFFIGNSSLKETAPQTAWAAMMAVSVAKALLVMLFFMHLIWEANWKYVLTIPAAMMSVFLVVMLIPDVGRRTKYYHPYRWLHAAEGTPHATAHTTGEHPADPHASDTGEASNHQPGASTAH
jgi:cytochrome c oxidase subunit 4